MKKADSKSQLKRLRFSQAEVFKVKATTLTFYQHNPKSRLEDEVGLKNLEAQFIAR